MATDPKRLAEADQVAALLGSVLAPMLANHYRGLLECGFSAEAALSLTVHLQMAFVACAMGPARQEG